MGHRHFFRAAVLGLALLAVHTVSAGCGKRFLAHDEDVGPAMSARIGSDEEDRRYWWSIRFRMAWPPESAPNFALDLLLADAVVEPVLEGHEEEIRFWRFHRRAIRDNSGHQFSFIFYATSMNAQAILSDLRRNFVLHGLLAGGYVEEVFMSEESALARPRIQDGSDPQWSSPLKQAWPAFIMGASITWLELINQYMGQYMGQYIGQYAGQYTAQAGGDLDELVRRYEKVDKSVTAIWKKEGQHAFLHHLNALFGYEPLSIKKDIVF